MKCGIILMLLLGLASCKNSNCIEAGSLPSGYQSVTMDVRCDEIYFKALEEGKKAGFCYNGPLSKGVHPEAVDPDHKKCRKILDEALRKCEALPPDSESMKQVSGSTFFLPGRKVWIDGKPIPICRNKDRKNN